MQLDIQTKAQQDLVYWVKHKPALARKIFELIANIQQTPYQGLGKPKLLRENLSGKWSRRITQEHRLIYSVTDDNVLVIFSCRYHYE
jgi:toxin YoeB